jgi:hypothetical protein
VDGIFYYIDDEFMGNEKIILYGRETKHSVKLNVGAVETLK